MARVFLSGPMGAGKTTVGRLVAARLGVPFLDLDERIEAHVGAPIATIFRNRGERGFRALEEQVLASLRAEGPRDWVLALGGGTVAGRAAARRAILFDGVLVTLAVSPEVAAARTAAQGGARPLLDGVDPVERLQALADERAAAYAECHATVDAEGGPPEAVAEAVLAVVADPPVPVPLGERSYRVEVGAGVRDRLGARLGDVDRLLVVVTDGHVDASWGGALSAALRGRQAVRVVLSPGEQDKHVGALERIWDAAIGAGADRDALVLAFGGGVVGDVAGLAAATLYRGVALGQVPTTLLAMVDSSVGGKTAIDRPEGKNLVGAFHQPGFVLCDVDFLRTLPGPERTAGLAEVVKAAWIDGEAAVAALEADAEGLRAGDDPEALVRAVRRAVALKARVVAEDEREVGDARRLLNLGHTVGHALETAAGFGNLRHGDAVALGLVAAFRVAVARGAASVEDARRLEHLLDRLGLPTDLDARLAPDVFAHVARDKKRAGDAVRFVVPGPPGQVRVERIPLATLPHLVAGI